MSDILKVGVGRLALVGLALAAAVGQAQAGAFGLNEYSAQGIGSAAAGAAAGNAGLGSIAWNPATMTDFAGFQTSGSFTWISPSASVKPSDGTVLLYSHLGAPTSATGDIGNGGRFVPATQVSYQLSDQWWLGLTVDAPFGQVTVIRPDAAAAYFGTNTQIVDVDVTPSLAYKVNDWLSLGAGLQINYFDLKVNNSLTPQVPGSALSVNGDSWGVGYKLGLTLKPFAGTEFGVGYRSQLQQNVSGNMQTNIPIRGLSGIILPGRQSVSSSVTLPDQLSVGLRQQVNDKVGVALGYQWTHWSLFKSFNVDGPYGPAIPLSFHYNNGWLISAGADYKWDARTTLRAGLGYEQSPINDVVRTPRLPDQNRIIAALGASYQLSSKMSLDLAYSHYFMPKANINITSTANPAYQGLSFVGSANGSVDIVSMALNFRWDAPEQIVAAKY